MSALSTHEWLYQNYHSMKLTLLGLLKAAPIGAILSMPVYLIEKYLYNDWDFAIYLSIVIVLDTFLGFYKNWINHTIWSEGIGGFFTKVIVYGCTLIVVHILVDFTIGGDKQMAFSLWDTILYSIIMVREVTSVFENIAEINPKLIPKWIVKRLKDFDSETGDKLGKNE